MPSLVIKAYWSLSCLPRLMLHRSKVDPYHLLLSDSTAQLCLPSMLFLNTDPEFPCHCTINLTSWISTWLTTFIGDESIPPAHCRPKNTPKPTPLPPCYAFHSRQTMLETSLSFISSFRSSLISDAIKGSNIKQHQTISAHSNDNLNFSILTLTISADTPLNSVEPLLTLITSSLNIEFTSSAEDLMSQLSAIQRSSKSTLNPTPFAISLAYTHTSVVLTSSWTQHCNCSHCKLLPGLFILNYCWWSQTDISNSAEPSSWML